MKTHQVNLSCKHTKQMTTEALNALFPPGWKEGDPKPLTRCGICHKKQTVETFRPTSGQDPSRQQYATEQQPHGTLALEILEPTEN